MAIPTFPDTIPGPIPFAGSFYLPQVKNDFEAPYQESRKEWTDGREKFTGFGWAYLTEDEFAVLLAFFKEVQGGTFYWNDDVTGKQYLLGSAADELKYQRVGGGGCSNVEWPLEERL